MEITGLTCDKGEINKSKLSVAPIANGFPDIKITDV
jgi:hypothetical protein